MRKQTKKILSWVLSAAMTLSLASGITLVTEKAATAAETGLSATVTVASGAAATLVDGTDIVSGGWASEDQSAFTAFVSHADAVALAQNDSLIMKATGADVTLQYQNDWSTVELKDGEAAALNMDKLAAIAAGDWEGLAITIPVGATVSISITVPEIYLSSTVTVASGAVATLVDGVDIVSGGWASEDQSAFTAFVSHADVISLASNGALSVKATGANVTLQYQNDWSTVELEDGVSTGLNTDKLAAIAAGDWEGLAITIPVGSTVKIEFSNIPVAVEEDPIDPVTPPEFPDYLDEEIWGTKGIHAYIMYQTTSWDYRNGYNAGKKNADKDSYAYIQAAGAEVNAEDVIVEDVLLDHNGEYTVSLEGVDLSGASAFKMLGLATDLDKYTYEGVKVDNATVSIDEEIVSGSDPVTLTAKEDNDYYTYMALNAYGAADEYYPMSAEDTDLPTDSIEITFTISGLDKALEDIENGSYIDPETGEPIGGGTVSTGSAVKDPTPTPPSNNNNNNNNNSSSNNNNTVKPTAKPAAKATVVGPKVGKTFTKGNFKYKVTKAATTKSSGKVTVTGLSKKGKKAKKLSVAATVKNTGSYKVTAIAKKSFKGAKATQITLNKNIKKIPANAFANCKKLKKLTLKAKLTSVAKKSFKGCKKKITVKGTSKKANVKKLKKSGYKKFK